jgi:hypothetical protein
LYSYGCAQQISSLLAGFATAQFTAALKAATYDAEKEPKARVVLISFTARSAEF